MKRIAATGMTIRKLGLVLAMLSISTAANAAQAVIFGSGTFSDAAPSTATTAPNGTWSFSFNLPNPIASNPVYEVTNFSYLLNGTPIAIGLSNVKFFNADDGGLFDLNFTDTTQIEYTGTDIGSTLTLLLGTFDANDGTSGSFFGDGGYIGSGSVTVANVSEPASLGILALGLAGLIARRRLQA